MTVPSPGGEPGQAILSLFDQLIQRIKQVQPVRSDDKPLGGGYVYELLPLGQPIDPDDYRDPWTPQGGGSVKDSPPATPPAAPAGPAGADPATAAAAQAVTDEAARGLAAAYKTALLATNLLQVTTDGTYLEYPTGQHLDFAYSGIINSMRPTQANEAEDPAILASIAAARKVLYVPNPDGTFSTAPTAVYQAYQDNTIAYGMATAAYATAFAATKTNRAAFDSWPVTSRSYQNAVDLARKNLISQGGPDVEKALDTLGSVGNPVQAHNIAQAIALYQEYNLGLAGAIPAPLPYSFISPSGWAKPNDKNGWTHISVTSQEYSTYDVNHASQSSDYGWLNKASSSSGSGGVCFGFGLVGGSGSSSVSSRQGHSGGGSIDYNHFKNTAKNLTISIWYALVTIERPWLVSDLFYMDGWHLRGSEKGSISTGKVADQAGTATHMLPMIPKQMLVIKDVEISTMDWGDDGTTLYSLFNQSQSSTSNSSSSVAGSVGVCLGPISFGGTAKHSTSTSSGQGSSFQARDGLSSFSSSFNHQKLTIPGAQIIAWLSDIVPMSPPDDDPQFGKTAATPTPAAG